MPDYCDPRTVNGPKSHVSNVRVIYDGGANDCAVAQLDWDGEPGVGLRWNGTSTDQPLGSPQSRGHPFWSANRFLNRVQVVPLSSNTSMVYPSEASVRIKDTESKAMADQLTTADKSRLTERLGTLSMVDLGAVEDAIRVQLAL